MIVLKITIAAILFADILLVFGIILKRAHRQFYYQLHLDRVEHYKKMIKISLDRRGKGIKGSPLKEIIRNRNAVKAALLSCVEETSSAVRKEKIYGFFREIGLANFYFARLSHSNPFSRAHAVEAIGNFKIKEAVEEIIDALYEHSDIVVSAAARALGKIGGRRAAEVLVGQLENPHLTKHSMIISLIEHIGSDAVPYLNSLIINSDAAQKAEAAKILGDIGDRRSIPILTFCLNSDNVNLRAKAAESLGKLKATSCLFHLWHLLNDPEWPVRSMAAKALGQIGHPDSVKYLEKAMTDPEWWVRKDAAGSLSVMGEAGERALISMLKSPDRFGREMAAAQLESGGLIRECELRLLSSDHDEARRAAKVLNDFDNVIFKSPMSIRVGAKKKQKVSNTARLSRKSVNKV